MSYYNNTLRNLDLPNKEWKELLLLEAPFLPKPKALESFLKKAKRPDQVSECEALVECEYLIKICLHHQKWYYRLSDPQITDALYDQLEKRIREWCSFFMRETGL